jgi:hypothetical protein
MRKEEEAVLGMELFKYAGMRIEERVSVHI